MKYAEEYLIYLNSFSANLAGPSEAMFYHERSKALAQAMGHLTAERTTQPQYIVHDQFSYWQFEQELQKLLDSVEAPEATK